jgi:hypothetical protein
MLVAAFGGVTAGLLIGLGVLGDTAPAAQAADFNPIEAAPVAGDPSVAQTSTGSALITLLNPGATARTVALSDPGDSGPVGLPANQRVEAGETRSFLVEVGPVPVDLLAQCNGCRSVTFAVADGQRIIVLILGASDAAAASRSDLHVVNESGRRQVGSLRTGDAVGFGLSTLRFDLAPNEAADVGLRLAASQMVAFNVTCAGCVGQVARIGNGVDLEIVLR